jgi:hypothetical protein
VAIDFPNGEKLFHPTHAANLAQANQICLRKLAADTTDSQEAKEAYCSCWADQVAHAAEMNTPPEPQLVAQKADTVFVGVYTKQESRHRYADDNRCADYCFNRC